MEQRQRCSTFPLNSSLNCCMASPSSVSSVQNEPAESTNFYNIATYLYMFRAFCQFTQFVNRATQFGNCQNARAIFKLRNFSRNLQIA